MAATMRSEAAGSGQRTGELSTAAGSGDAVQSTATSPMRCTQEDTWTPRRPSSAMATPPAATRAAVSRALARSRTSRASSRSCFSMPARSACPGRTRITGFLVKPPASTCIGPFQFSQSRFRITRASGEPRVRPPRTPPTISAWSRSISWRLPRPYPPWRRRRWGSMSRRTSSGSPAGRPSTMTVSWGPWDSPAVRKRSTGRILRGGGGGHPGLALPYPATT